MLCVRTVDGCREGRKGGSVGGGYVMAVNERVNRKRGGEEVMLRGWEC